jgi:hypothetical protein
MYTKYRIMSFVNGLLRKVAGIGLFIVFAVLAFMVLKPIIMGILSFVALLALIVLLGKFW